MSRGTANTDLALTFDKPAPKPSTATTMFLRSRPLCFRWPLRKYLHCAARKVLTDQIPRPGPKWEQNGLVGGGGYVFSCGPHKRYGRWTSCRVLRRTRTKISAETCCSHKLSSQVDNYWLSLNIQSDILNMSALKFVKRISVLHY